MWVGRLSGVAGDVAPGCVGAAARRADRARGVFIDPEKVHQTAVSLAEESGIVFLDEVDKIAGDEGGGRGPDVSRQGVQRDLLPIVEGTTVNTKYGPVRTDHVLFVAAGAFHRARPSDLMPELQGRFPIRVELKDLTKEDFIRAVKNVPPARVQRYSVTIGRLQYPTRQVVALATGRPSIEFTSAAAYRILQKFGFDIDVWE